MGGSNELLQSETNVKWGRALLHFSLYLTFASIYQYGGLSKQAALTVYVLFAIPMVFLDVLRFYSPWWQEFVNNSLYAWNIIKTSELNKVSALSEGIMGLMVVMVFCPKETAIVAALCVGSIDPAARIIGMKFGENKFRNGKSAEGMIAGLVAGFVIVEQFSVTAGIVYSLEIGFAVLAGAIGEVLVTKRDNIIIPISVASMMTFMQMIMGGVF